MNGELRRPLIFNIRHFALDDGPGIRTTVFFKGCPLSCVWCHNPESMTGNCEIAFHRDLCIACGDCATVCGEGAVDLASEQRIRRDGCTRCGRCAEACPTTALRLIGVYYPPDDLIETLMKDRLFYETSKGGVTFSGGEPSLYPDYLAEVMEKLKRAGIPVALQTCGAFDLGEFQKKILPSLDLLYYDIKLFENEAHGAYTGSANDRILENFIRLVQSADVEIIPRVPLVPAITATKKNLAQIADFLSGAGCRAYELLLYNSGGIPKRQWIGRAVPETIDNLRFAPGEEEKWREFFDGCFNASLNGQGTGKRRSRT